MLRALRFPPIVVLTSALWLSPAAADADPVDHFLGVDDADGVGSDKIPHRGRPRVLIVGVPVADAAVPPHYADFFADETAYNNFRRYWRVQSLGRYDPEPGYFEVPAFPACPGESRDVLDRMEAPYCPYQPLLIEALREGLAEVGRSVVAALEPLGRGLCDFDRTGPDGVPDGWVDGVLILTASHGAALPGLAEQLAEGRGIWESTDGCRANWFALAEAGRPDARHQTAVALHEWGHPLGLTDLYPLRFPWGLMANMGACGEGGCAYAPLDAFSRIKLGWSLLEWPRTSGAIDLPPSLTTGRVVRLGAGPVYYLLENGEELAPYLDRGGGINPSRGRGLTVYRVDERRMGRGRSPPWLAIQSPEENPRAYAVGETADLKEADGADLARVEVVGLDEGEADCGLGLLRVSITLAQPNGPPERCLGNEECEGDRVCRSGDCVEQPPAVSEGEAEAFCEVQPFPGHLEEPDFGDPGCHCRAVGGTLPPGDALAALVGLAWWLLRARLGRSSRPALRGERR